MEETSLLTSTVTIESSKIATEENLENQKEEKQPTPNESEYDSAGSYSEEGEYDGKNNDFIDDEADISERQEGDGEESTPQKKVDDDEDKKNPQYIPKRGTFYEHDDRTADDEIIAEIEKQEKQEKDNKKKLWQDKKEKWSHDKFNDQEQAPKSKTELVQIYGYDIRNEDGPPKPRRRRRYGRGPNKYTRNWKDEDAYNKLAISKPPSKKIQNQTENEEFPPLEQLRNYSKHTDRIRTKKDFNARSNKNSNSRRSEESEEYSQRSHPQQENANKSSNLEPGTSENNTAQIAPVRQTFEVKNNTIRDSDYKGFTKVSMGKNLRNSNAPKPPPKKDANNFILSQNFSSKKQNPLIDLNESMSNMAIESRNSKGNSQRQSIPPRLQQTELKGSKRYSSIRQRSLPETNSSPIIPSHSSYYGNDLNQTQTQQTAGAAQPPSVIHQNLLQSPGGVSQMAPSQAPVTAVPSILQAPPPQQFAAAFPQQPPTYLQAPVPPPTFIPQQAPSLLNYVQTQPQFPAGGGYQSFQAPFNPVTQSTELYQPQGGITYYSTDQQIAQRTVPQKRPKAAIPIVAPPNFDSKNLKQNEENLMEYSVETNTNTVG